jgi:hypothetical protein
MCACVGVRHCGALDSTLYVGIGPQFCKTTTTLPSKGERANNTILMHHKETYVKTFLVFEPSILMKISIPVNGTEMAFFRSFTSDSCTFVSAHRKCSSTQATRPK